MSCILHCRGRGAYGMPTPPSARGAGPRGAPFGPYPGPGYAPRGGGRGYPPRGRGQPAYGPRGPPPADYRGPPWPAYGPAKDERARGRSGYYKHYEADDGGRVSSPDSRYHRSKAAASGDARSDDDVDVKPRRKRAPTELDEQAPRKRYRDTSPLPGGSGSRPGRSYSPAAGRSYSPAAGRSYSPAAGRSYSPAPAPPMRGSRSSGHLSSPGAGSDPDAPTSYRRAPPPPPPSRRAPPPPSRPPVRRGMTSPSYSQPSRHVETRTQRRATDEQNAPIAKRLRKP